MCVAILLVAFCGVAGGVAERTAGASSGLPDAELLTLDYRPSAFSDDSRYMVSWQDDVGLVRFEIATGATAPFPGQSACIASGGDEAVTIIDNVAASYNFDTEIATPLPGLPAGIGTMYEPTCTPDLQHVIITAERVVQPVPDYKVEVRTFVVHRELGEALELSIASEVADGIGLSPMYLTRDGSAVYSDIRSMGQGRTLVRGALRIDTHDGSRTQMWPDGNGASRRSDDGRWVEMGGPDIGWRGLVDFETGLSMNYDDFGGIAPDDPSGRFWSTETTNGVIGVAIERHEWDQATDSWCPCRRYVVDFLTGAQYDLPSHLGGQEDHTMFNYQLTADSRWLIADAPRPNGGFDVYRIELPTRPLAPLALLCFTANGKPGDAAVVNLTPVNAGGSGSGQLVPSNAAATPVASNVNFRPGSSDPNVAVATIGGDGQVCYHESRHAGTHLVADHLGTITAGAYTPATQAGTSERRLDTRTGHGGARIPPNGRVCFPLAGNPGDAAIVNLTPVNGDGPGNGQLVASNVTGQPDASNVNYTATSVDPNIAIATIGTDGQVCYLNSRHSAVDLVADHLGTISRETYTPASGSGAPVRVLDTRTDPTTGRIAPNGRACFTVAGDTGAIAVVNLTPILAAGNGNGQLLSSDVVNAPVASNVNFGPGTVDPNVAFAPIGADGRVCFVNSQHATVDLVADHLGTIDAAAYTSATGAGVPDRLVDTRIAHARQ